ncbi:casein kinase substrate phospho protein PP28-domain-containing protein [Naematelia encephala]|uniref:Casein kinase substrate phospho protein PP28-domain-containing protein n=1 Tax=Naematelia encephala TaxID=71784 RepID=A0A1Y2AYX8_9TREE|nr:casein kinase substrate phospho protein PP28-domain-containing protein [Naematelia encephala]
MGRGGGVSSRGRGKFKVARGGGRNFSRDLDPRKALGAESSEEEDSSEEESSDDDDTTDPSNALATPSLAPEMAALNLKLGNTVAVVDEEPGMSRAERKALKKKEADQAAKRFAIDEVSEDEDSDDGRKPAPKSAAKSKVVAQELSRKEKEAADKKAAQERYAKLHAQGKTVEAKTDLARLQEVRRRREAAAAQREAEAEEAAKEAAAKKEKAAARR